MHSFQKRWIKCTRCTLRRDYAVLLSVWLDVPSIFLHHFRRLNSFSWMNYTWKHNAIETSATYDLLQQSNRAIHNKLAKFIDHELAAAECKWRVNKRFLFRLRRINNKRCVTHSWILEMKTKMQQHTTALTRFSQSWNVASFLSHLFDGTSTQNGNVVS